MPKKLLIILALLSSLAGSSQFFKFRRLEYIRHYFFNHFTTTSGLISYQINSTVQDENGFIWVGTNDGLQRYDGVRFKTFRHNENDSASIPSNLIWQLILDKDKNLWVLTIDGKAGIFNTSTFRFSPAEIRLKNQQFFVSNAPFKRLITDEFGNVFLLVPNSEFATYNKVTHTFSPEYNFPGLAKDLKLQALVQQPGTTKYWLSNDELGLAVFNSSNGQLSHASNNMASEKAIEQFKDNHRLSNMYFDKRKRFWIIADNPDSPSVSCYDMMNQRLLLNKYHFDRNVLGYHEIRSFFEQADSTVWIIGQRVFAKFLEKEKEFEQVYNGNEEEHGIDYITMTCLTEDREHSIWASTANNGIFRCNPSKNFFTNIHYVSHTTGMAGSGGAVSFLQQHDATLLIGIRDDGLYRFDKDLNQLPLNINGIPDKNNTVIWDMCFSADSNIVWMAAQNGIYKYDQSTKKVVYLQPTLLTNKTVKRIVEDKRGNLWLGTQDAGLFKWNSEKGKTKFDEGLSAFSEISSVRVNRIVTDKLGNIWVATNITGAYMIDPLNDSVCKHFYEKGIGRLKLPEQNVLSVMDYNDSLFIIGNNSRLVVYNRKRDSSYLLGNSLSGFISSIEKDENGHLWVSTSTSIYRVTVNSRVFVQMNRNDGLGNDYFLPGGSRTLPDKRMLFGVYGAIIEFDPSAISPGPMYPDLKITGFTVKDKSLLVDSLLQQKLIVLSPEENSLVIDLSVLSYNSGYLLKAKLEGLDKEWKTVGQNYQLVYSYLPPGKYTLYVETIDADGNHGEKTIQLAIRINAPFYKTTWFWASLILVFVLLLFWLDRQRTARRTAMQKMRSNIADNLHREVNTTLNNINILSEMAKLKADNNREKSKEFISQINIKSEAMIIAMNDMLWSIDPANDSMPKFVDRLREFIDALNSGHNAGVELTIDAAVERVRLPMQLRHSALILIKECIQSEVYCGAKCIDINIYFEKSNLIFSSRFNPDGCDMKQLSNILYSKDMERRLQAVGGKLDADDNKSDVVAVLKIPVK